MPNRAPTQASCADANRAPTQACSRRAEDTDSYALPRIGLRRADETDNGKPDSTPRRNLTRLEIHVWLSRVSQGTTRPSWRHF
jgi:hypothetical protein